jgi:hypothetical protein
MALEVPRNMGTGTDFAQEADSSGKNMVSEIRACPHISLIHLGSYPFFA